MVRRSLGQIKQPYSAPSRPHAAGFEARWAGDNAVLPGQGIGPPIPPLRLIPELGLLTFSQ